jgi:Mn-dependent DtxR family transcriptional regulator
LDRPLRALRDEKLIIGGPKTYFILTEKGEKKAAAVSKKLRQGKLL